MKVCSVCNEIVATGQGCTRSDCPNQAEATVTSKFSSNPKRTAKADRVAQTGLGTPSDRALDKSRPALIGIGAAACLGGAIFLAYQFFDTAASPWAYEQIDLEVGPEGIATPIDYDKQATIGIEGISHSSLRPGEEVDAYAGGYVVEGVPPLGEVIISRSADCGGLEFTTQGQLHNNGERIELEVRRIEYSSQITGFRFRMDESLSTVITMRNLGNIECSYFQIDRNLDYRQWEQDDETARRAIAQAGAITRASLGWVYTAEGLERRLASADAVRGEAAVAKCISCHTFNEGGMNGVGPNLYGVIGRDIASRNDFTYSTALSEAAGEWDFAQLDRLLARPNAFAPGTKMSFPGLSNAQERADIIAYLNLWGSAVSLPTVPPE